MAPATLEEESLEIQRGWCLGREVQHCFARVNLFQGRNLKNVKAGRYLGRTHLE